MKRLFLILFLVTLSFPAMAQNKSPEQVQIFANDKAGKPYIILGQLVAKATQNEDCIKKLQKKTAGNGGNVLINFESNATGTQGAWLGSAVIICRGIAARWAMAGEQGQTSIDPNAPLPVLTK